MTDLIHFHVSARATGNIGDAAIVISMKNLLHHCLKISVYDSIDVNRLKGVYGLYNPLTQIRSPEMINKHDLCIIGGGGLYSDWFFPLNDQLIKSVKIPIILYGIGHQRNFERGRLSETQIRSIVLLNKCARLSSVRDVGTYHFLRNLTMRDADIVGDPAIFLETRKLKKSTSNESGLKVGINIAYHKWKLQSHYIGRVIAAYIKTCKFLIQNYNAQIVYLKHASGENAIIDALRKDLSIQVADYCPVHGLAYGLKGKLQSLVPLQDREDREDCVRRLNDVYSTLDLVISMNMHSAVFAFANNVPVLSIAYDVKNYYFMDLIRQGDKVIRVDEINSDNLKKMTMLALDNATAIKRDFKRSKSSLWEKQKTFLKKIKSI